MVFHPDVPSRSGTDPWWISPCAPDLQTYQLHQVSSFDFQLPRFPFASGGVGGAKTCSSNLVPHRRVAKWPCPLTALPRCSGIGLMASAAKQSSSFFFDSKKTCHGTSFCCFGRVFVHLFLDFCRSASWKSCEIWFCTSGEIEHPRTPQHTSMFHAFGTGLRRNDDLAMETSFFRLHKSSLNNRLTLPAA